MNVLDSVWLEQSKKDKIIKEIILTADFETAYYTVCKYITCRSLQPLHASIIHNVSDNQASMDLAPRGHGKSTIGDVDFCITKVLRNPDIRIMIGSKTQTQASAFLKEIRTHFEQNVNLIRIFGDWKKSRDNVWNDKEFTVNRRTVIKKEATVSALGASGAVVSKHFDIIIGDDLVGFENARTEAQRKVLKEWFYSSLYPTLEPDGEIHILGTRYSPMDLYEDLIKSKNYKVNVQQAITVKDGQEYSLWESKFSLEKLRSIREEAGLIIFNMQYQNNTELAKGKIFKYKYFKHFEEYDIDYDLNRVRVKVLDSQGVPYWIPVRIYMGADLAISEDETSNNDYFVFSLVRDPCADCVHSTLDRRG